MVRQGRSVSFKIIEIDSNRKPVCDFLLVFRCNYVPIFYRFRELTIYLPPTTDCWRLFVCLSVCVQDYSKTRGLIWMKCCVSTNVGTWRNLLTFEPNPDHTLDAKTGLFSPISYALQRAEFYYVGGNPTYRYWAWLFGASGMQRRVVLRRRKTVVGGKCAPPSDILVSRESAFFAVFTYPSPVSKASYPGT